MYSTLEVFKPESKIHKHLFKLFGNKHESFELLFLENQTDLGDSAVNNFRIWCIENKVKHNVLYDVSELPFEYLSQRIMEASFIAFETTGTYEISKKIADFLISVKKQPKHVIECYIEKPIFQKLPKDANHVMYSLGAYDEDMDRWELSKLSKSKYYWDTKLVSRH